MVIMALENLYLGSDLAVMKDVGEKIISKTKKIS